MASSGAAGGRGGGNSQQKEVEDYLSRIKLREIFQGMLTHVVVHQPEDPVAYFHEELSRIKKEVEENNVDIASTTFLTSSNYVPKDRGDQQ
ncbi:hypothetical protein GBAR_LOCUS17944 [Geodia barretti]|uniref:Uncharacterized protein n=1 Tax=Geodia barretti TaxID=519541 RepID=A0AA35WYQ2_GEOBA|nr:hypothetical protein GBAR_LOCUS17944 [Geodia barretti]